MRTARQQLSIKIACWVFSPAILLLPVLAFAQGPVIVTPSQLVWKPLIPGVEMAVVSGDPDKKGGVYVIRIRAKGEVQVPPHWHPADEHITVLEGSFLLAHGEKYDASKLIQLKPGAHSRDAGKVAPLRLAQGRQRGRGVRRRTLCAYLREPGGRPKQSQEMIVRPTLHDGIFPQARS